MKYRQIKFRVYNEKAKEWVHGPHENSTLDGVNLFGEIIMFGMLLDGVASKDFNDCVALQFTGLKDSGGKEIFEGDIVNVNGSNHIIEWRGAGFAATWSDYNLDTCWFVGGAPVVVGNIFENPELAEKARKSPKISTT
jgi:uncharacterized phage protein (TIGR01671 family)